MKGHITKRSPGTWSIVIELGRDNNGKRKQQWSTVNGTKKEAETEMRRIITSIENGDYIEPSKLTVGKYLERWLEQIKPTITTKTYIRYESICIKHLVPALGNHKIKRLAGLHIESYYTKARKEGRIDGKGRLAERTLLHHHRVLSEAMKHAVKLKLRSSNPASDVTTPKPTKVRVTALDEEQTVALLKVAENTELYAPILFAVTTGLRRGEIVGLKWADIDLENAIVSVNRAVQQTKGLVEIKLPKTTSGTRSISIPGIAVDALQVHKAAQNKQRLLCGPVYQNDDWVFARDDGALWKPDSFTQAYRRFIEKSGLPKVGFHTLRHSHASQLLKMGVHPKVAQERLGHSSIAITMDLYSHLLKGVQKEAANKIDQALRNELKRTSK